MAIQLLTKNEILSNLNSVMNSQLGLNLLNYVCPDSVLLLKVVYVFIYHIMDDNMIINLINSSNEFAEMRAHKSRKSRKVRKSHIERKFITQLYDTITNEAKTNKIDMYIKRRYFTAFLPLSYKVFNIFYDINSNCLNTQTYTTILLGIYIMNMTC